MEACTMRSDTPSNFRTTAILVLELSAHCYLSLYEMSVRKFEGVSHPANPLIKSGYLGRNGMQQETNHIYQQKRMSGPQDGATLVEGVNTLASRDESRGLHSGDANQRGVSGDAVGALPCGCFQRSVTH